MGVVVVVPEVLEVLELLDESSSFAQEMIVRLIRNRERIMIICLTWFPSRRFRRTLHIPKYGGFYKNMGILRRVSDCEELEWTQFQERNLI